MSYTLVVTDDITDKQIAIRLDFARDFPDLNLAGQYEKMQYAGGVAFRSFLSKAEFHDHLEQLHAKEARNA